MDCETPFEGLQILVNEGRKDMLTGVPCGPLSPTNTPALDPCVIDLDGKLLTKEIVSQALYYLKYRLEQARLNYDIKILFAGPKENFSLIKNLFNSPLIKINTLEGYNLEVAYLLTLEAAGQHLITPPYDPANSVKPLSWNEYFLRVAQGEDLRISIRATWAQIKFTNIGKA